MQVESKKNYYDSCASDDECALLPNSMCFKNVCTCRPSYRFTKGICRKSMLRLFSLDSRLTWFSQHETDILASLHKPDIAKKLLGVHNSRRLRSGVDEMRRK